MIEKALIIIIFVYASGFGILAVQYALADVFGISLKNFEGADIKSNLVDIIRLDELNELQANIVTANFTENSTAFDRVEDSVVAAAFVAWELILLMTGTYVFNILILLGIPAPIVAGLIFLYVMLLARAILAYIRGI